MSNGDAARHAECNDDLHWYPISRCKDFGFTASFQHGVLVVTPSVIIALMCICTLMQPFRQSPGQGIHAQSLASRDDARYLTPVKAVARLLQHTSATGLVELSILGLCTAVSAWQLRATATQTPILHPHPWPTSLELAGRCLTICIMLLLTAAIPILHRIRPGGGSVPRTRLQLAFATMLAGHAVLVFSEYSASDQETPRLSRNLEALATALVGSLLLVESAGHAILSSSLGPAVEHSEQAYGLLGRATMLWTLPLFIKGAGTYLGPSELYRLQGHLEPEQAGRRLATALDEIRHREPLKSRIRGGRLILALLRAFPGIYAGPLLPRFVLLCSMLAQPLAVSALISMISNSGSGTDKTEAQEHPRRAWALVAGIGLLYLSAPLTMGVLWYHLNNCDLVFRSAVVSCLFRRMACKEGSLHIRQHMQHPSANGPPSLGQTDKQSKCVDEKEQVRATFRKRKTRADHKMTGGNHPDFSTRMSVDVEIVAGDMFMFALHEAWAVIPNIIVGTWMLVHRIGVAGVSCAATLLICACASSMMNDRLASRQKAWLRETSARASFVSVLAAKLRIVLASSYQQYFSGRSQTLREAEVKSMKHYYRLLALSAGLLGSCSGLATVAMFALCQVFPAPQRTLDAATIFSSLTILNTMNLPIQILAQLIGRISAGFASLERLEEALMGSDSSSEPLPEESLPSIQADLEQAAGELCRFLAEWMAYTEQSGRSRVFRLIGPSSSGKTALATHMLHHFLSATDTKVAYSPQTTALFDDRSIADNITLCQTTSDDNTGYGVVGVAEAIQLCGLQHDVAALECGLLTQVGDLSGGQRQRVALARTFYSSAQLVVLDDPFSALDAATACEIQSNLYGAASLSSTNILCGRVVLWVSSAETQYDAPESIFRTSIRDGRFYLERPRLSPSRLLSAPVPKTSPASSVTAIDTKPTTLTAASTHSTSTKPECVSKKEEEQHTKRLGAAPYLFWASNAPIGWVLLSALLVTLEYVGQYACQYVLQGWSGESGSAPNLSETGKWLPLLAFVCVAGAVAGGLKYVTLFAECMPATGAKIYKKVMDALLATSPYNSLLPAQLKGRLTQDLYIVDVRFGQDMLYASGLIQLIMGFATILIATPLVVLCLPLIALQFWAVWKGYLPASQQVRSMELEAKTSLFALFAQVEACLPTMQLLRVIPACVQRCDRILGETQKPVYTRQAMLRLLRVAFHGVVWVITLLMAVIAVALSGRVSPSLLGVALSNVSALGWALNSTLQAFVALETDAVALERIRQITALEPEEVGQASQEKADRGVINTFVPTDGAVVLEARDLSLRYSRTSSDVFTDLAFAFTKGARIGICGRSGSGKSSLLAAILRGVPDALIGGQLTMLGHDRSEVDLQAWRRCFSYVAQEPLIWEGTVRELLLVRDPSSSEVCSKDEGRLWEALDAVGLSNAFRGTADGLDTKVRSADSARDNGATVLSASQKHLLAFARTLLETERHFLLMDETTSTLDDEAEQLTMETVLESPLLKERTILAVSHRIRFIIHFDYILVMEDGRIVEQGTPQQLLQTSANAPPSRFHQLCELQGGAKKLTRRSWPSCKREGGDDVVSQDNADATAQEAGESGSVGVHAGGFGGVHSR